MNATTTLDYVLAVDLGQPTGHVTISDESLLWPKTHIHLGVWNVCVMFETSKMAQVINEMYCNGYAKRDGHDMGRGTTCCKGPIPLETLLKPYVPPTMKRST